MGAPAVRGAPARHGGVGGVDTRIPSAEQAGAPLAELVPRRRADPAVLLLQALAKDVASPRQASFPCVAVAATEERPLSAGVTAALTEDGRLLAFDL